MSSRVLGCEENLYFERWNSPTNLDNQGQSRSLLINHAVSNRTDLREHTKTMHSHGDRRGQIGDFRDSFERIKWLYLHSKCGIKTKPHFEWLLWHWSSLGQLNLEPARPFSEYLMFKYWSLRVELMGNVCTIMKTITPRVKVFILWA